MKHLSWLEIIYGCCLGTVLFIGICMALASLTYAPKGKTSDKPYFVYQGY